jgi:hypothetical protein
MCSQILKNIKDIIFFCQKKHVIFNIKFIYFSFLTNTPKTPVSISITL